MKYKQFTIFKFKGINALILDLAKLPSTNIFTLVGLNESGKTTILEALHWFYKPDHYNPHHLIPKSDLLNFNGSISVEATIFLTEEDFSKLSKHLHKQHKFTIKNIIKEIKIKREFTYQNSSINEKSWIWSISIFGKTKRMKIEKELDRTSPIWQDATDYISEYILSPIIYYENFLFNFPDKIYVKLKNGQQLKNPDLFYKDVIQDVLNSMEKDLSIDSHIIERYESEKSHDKAAMESVLDKLSSKIRTEVFAMWRDLLKIKGEGLSITLGQTLEEDTEGYYLQVKVKEGDQSYFIRERSLGFRWFFSFILFTHFRSFREKHYKHSLFLLDEPASNLHPTAQTKLLSAFSNFPKEQTIIYTTHSHHMINPKWLAGTFVVKNEAKEYDDLDVSYNSYMTKIVANRYYQFVSNHPNDKDFFRPILDALDYQPSLLEATPEIVITEGKNDFYALMFANQQDIFKSDRIKFIYPSTGKDKTDYIISLYLGWGSNFLVILDDDSGGRQTYNRVKKDYGPILENSIFKLSSINKAWQGFTLENLFSDSDKLKIIKMVYPDHYEYVKSNFNIAIQDCFINGHQIDLSKETNLNFKTLFSFLNTKLEENRKA